MPVKTRIDLKFFLRLSKARIKSPMMSLHTSASVFRLVETFNYVIAQSQIN